MYTDDPASLDQALRNGFPTLPDLIDAEPEAPTGQAEFARIDHAHDEQRRPILPREVECPVGRELTCRRQIGRQQHLPDRETFRALS